MEYLPGNESVLVTRDSCFKYIKSMKNLFVVVAVVLLCGNMFAQGIEFEHGTFSEALAKAKAEKKMVFMDCYTTWCGPCKMLAKKVFTQKEVGDFFNANFVNVKMDMEKGEGVELAKKYNVKAYPTLLWLDGDGNIQHKSIGGGNAKMLVDIAKTANDPNKNWAALEKKYKSGERSVEFLQNYVLTGSKCGFNITEASEAYYNKRKPEDLINQKDLEIIKNIVKETSHDKFIFVIENKDKFYKVSSKAEVDQFLERTMGMELGMAMRSGDASKIESKKKELIKLDEGMANKIFAGMELQKLYRDTDKSKFFNALADFGIKYEFDNSGKLNEYAWMIVDSKVELSNDIMSKGLKMAKRSVELDTNFANTDTYAFILYKVGQKDKAKEYAAKSVELAPEEHKNDLWSLKYIKGEL